MSRMKCLIAYLSYSGNTEEVAELIQQVAEKQHVAVDMHEIGIDEVSYPLDEYDVIFIGTFTWDLGRTPEEIKEFVLDVGYKPDNIAVFGTGDTQFGGDDLFCKAVDRLVKFYNSKWDGLKIEQSPRGYQEQFVIEWAERVLESVKATNKSKNIRATLS